MSALIEDDALLDDMAAALRAIRGWLMEVGEQHASLNAQALDDLLRRYKTERDYGEE